MHVTIDPNNLDKAFISSWNDGILVIEEGNVKTLWNDQNSGLERLVNPGFPDFYSIRISGTAFDNQGNLWVANSWVNKSLKKLFFMGA